MACVGVHSGFSAARLPHVSNELGAGVERSNFSLFKRAKIDEIQKKKTKKERERERNIQTFPNESEIMRW